MKTSIFKRFLACGAAALCFLGAGTLPAAHASMPAWNVTREMIEAIQGTWYDLDGNVAFVVSGDNFNGRRIIHAMNFSGPRACIADFFLEGESIGEGPGRFIAWTPSRRFLTVEGKTYRNTREPEYFESVRGVYLGMKQEDMLALLGEPEKAARNGRFVWSDMAVNTENGIVRDIFLLPGGACLDRSGLGASDAPEDYTAAYGADADLAKKPILEIGPCREFLRFEDYPKHIKLSIYGMP